MAVLKDFVEVRAKRAGRRETAGGRKGGGWRWAKGGKRETPAIMLTLTFFIKKVFLNNIFGSNLAISIKYLEIYI